MILGAILNPINSSIIAVSLVYLGAIIAAAANGAFLRRRADTAGLHYLAVFTLAVAVVFLAVTALDRSLTRVGR
jgi:hypothetical protein